MGPAKRRIPNVRCLRGAAHGSARTCVQLTIRAGQNGSASLIRLTPRRSFWASGELIADNLSKAGWSWGCVSAVDCEGRTIWIADAHRGDGKRFVVRAHEKLIVFVELESGDAARR